MTIANVISVIAPLAAFTALVLSVTLFRFNRKKHVDEEKLSRAVANAEAFENEDSFTGIFSKADVFNNIGEKKRVGRRWCLYVFSASILMLILRDYLV